MREIDSDALRDVAESLQIRNPTTAVGQVLFDDENLQQAHVVTPLLPGLGTERGWFGAIQDHDHTADGTLRNTLDIYARVSSPTGGLGFHRDRRRTDIWLYTVDHSIEDAGATLVRLISALFIPAVASSPFITSDYVHILRRSDSTRMDTAAVIAGGFLSSFGIDRTSRQLPIFVPHTAELAMVSQVTLDPGPPVVPATARTTYILWAGPRGLRPPLT